MKTTACAVALFGSFCALLPGFWESLRVILALALIGFAARHSINRSIAVPSGYRKIVQARQIDHLIGAAVHSIVNEGDENGEGIREEWVSEVYFEPRYEMEMRVGIRVNPHTSEVAIVTGIPIFVLREIEKIDMSSGSPSISYRTAAQRTFNAVEWDKVVKAKGDLSVTGIRIQKSPPIADFDRLLKWSRARTPHTP